MDQSFKVGDRIRRLSADKLQMCRWHNGGEPGSGPAQPGNRHASQVIERLGQVFDYRFCDLDQLQPCVSFICNAFMNMDKSCNAEQ